MLKLSSPRGHKILLFSLSYKFKRAKEKETKSEEEKKTFNTNGKNSRLISNKQKYVFSIHLEYMLTA